MTKKKERVSNNCVCFAGSDEKLFDKKQDGEIGSNGAHIVSYANCHQIHIHLREHDIRISGYLYDNALRITVIPHGYV